MAKPNLPTTKGLACMEKSLEMIYMTGSNNTLKQPLGHWYHAMAHQHWQWEWVVCPASLTLYHQYKDCWISYQVNAHQWRYATFDCMPNSHQCQLPPNAIPATPHVLEDNETIILFLPVQPFHELNPSPQPNPSLLIQLTMPAEPWEWNCGTESPCMSRCQCFD